MCRFLSSVAIAMLLLVGTGCFPPADTGSNNPMNTPDNSDDAGGTFSQAKGVSYDSSNLSVITGNIADASDVDVYNLGPLSAGDRIVVNVDGAASLDGDAACFDAQGRLFRENDDEDLAANKLDPYFDEIVRHDSSPYFLAITSSPFGPSSGDYTANVQIIRGAETTRVVGAAVTAPTDAEILASLANPSHCAEQADAKRAAIEAAMMGIVGPKLCGNCIARTAPASKKSGARKLGGSEQIFLFDYDGATVDIPGDQTYNIPAFDAADIDSAYEGKTDDIKQVIMDIFLARYGDLDIVVYTTDDADPPPEPFTRIAFGGLNPTIFGIAQDIDPFNADPSDEAVVFTGTFNPHVFGKTLTVEELGEALGQVAAHEAGHTLGLYHVADVTDLMDTTGGPSTLIEVQTFKNSILDETVFPIGDQDSQLLLEETVGVVQ